MVYYTKCSKCPPPALTHARSLLVKLSTALLIEFCSNSSQIDCRTSFSASMLFGFGWNMWLRSGIIPRHNNPVDSGPESSVATHPCRWIRCSWWWSSLAPHVHCVQMHRPVGKWSQLAEESCSLQPVSAAKYQRKVLRSSWPSLVWSAIALYTVEADASWNHDVDVTQLALWTRRRFLSTSRFFLTTQTRLFWLFAGGLRTWDNSVVIVSELSLADVAEVFGSVEGVCLSLCPMWSVLGHGKMQSKEDRVFWQLLYRRAMNV